MDDAEMRRYEAAARYGNGKAAFVVLPRTTEAVAEVISICRKHAVALIPQGANTGLVGAAVPDSSGRQGILSLEKFAGELAVDVANRSVRVSAGVRLSVLNDELAKHGLFYPIDLGADPSIGGMVATNTGGSRFIRYGDVRKSVLGLEVVLADDAGTRLDLGSGLRKNNVGLDLKQLFIGTGGAYGVITRVDLEVQPLPRQSATALIAPQNRKAVVPLLLASEAAFGGDLTSFEGMSGEAISCVLRHIPGTRNPFFPEAVPEYAALIELTRASDEADSQPRLSEHLSTFLEQQLEAGTITNAVMDHPASLWKIRHSISEALRDEGHVIGLDISTKRPDLEPFHAEARALLLREYPWLLICDFGHCGDGGDHFNLVWPHRDVPAYDANVAATVRERIYRLLADGYGGSFSAEHGTGPANLGYRKSLLDPASLDIEARIGGLLTNGQLLGRALV
ncbi:FAD-binding oxidoreductase [Labrys okinawensis]|uniref:FAD-binding oxidoreductase n=1 Tax=Labrys okinawensis TaxID=346911 RepID=UPI0039BC7C8A